jgi:Uma2 family endonuclease
MTALPVWMTEQLTAEAYEALPEDVCRSIEVVDGAIVVSPALTRRHQVIARRLANALEHACPADLCVNTDVDLRLADVPLLNRRPDVVVYRASLPDDEVLRPVDVTLVAEVTSPGSVATDRIDKHAEYAAAGITWYWRIDPASGALSIYRHNRALGAYQLTTEVSGVARIAEPFPMDLDLTSVLAPRRP